MTEKPNSHQEHDNGQSIGDASKEPTNSPVVDNLSDLIVGQEPLSDCASNGQHHQGEWDTVPTFILGKLFGAQHARSTTGDVCQRHPQPGDSGVFTSTV